MTDDEMMLVSAVRYALPRATYIVGVTANEVKRRWSSLSRNARDLIISDIQGATEGRQLNGVMMDMDRKIWVDLLEYCRLEGS